MVALARSLHPGIAFREADVEDLPLGDGDFDALVCGFGLGHFPRPELAVAGVFGVVAARKRALACGTTRRVTASRPSSTRPPPRSARRGRRTSR